jgi:hypothetical protein
MLLFIYIQCDITELLPLLERHLGHYFTNKDKVNSLLSQMFIESFNYFFVNLIYRTKTVWFKPEVSMQIALAGLLLQTFVTFYVTRNGSLVLWRKSVIVSNLIVILLRMWQYPYPKLTWYSRFAWCYLINVALLKSINYQFISRTHFLVCKYA